MKGSHLDRAKEEIATGDFTSAIGHALISIAESLALSAPTPVSIQVCPECSEVSFGAPDDDPVEPPTNNAFAAWRCIECGRGIGIDHTGCFQAKAAKS